MSAFKPAAADGSKCTKIEFTRIQGWGSSKPDAVIIAEKFLLCLQPFPFLDHAFAMFIITTLF
jgi:hypothetical protein